jgi:hypothetical protein
MFLGSAPMSLLGVALATWLVHHYGDSVDAVTGRLLGAALVFGALGLLAKSLLRPNAIASGAVLMTNRNRIAAVLIGLFGALLYVAGVGHLVAGNVDLRVVGWLLLGSIPGILVGSQWSIRLPEAVLRRALATLLLLTGGEARSARWGWGSASRLRSESGLRAYSPTGSWRDAPDPSQRSDQESRSRSFDLLF